jgi:hypothetical protein
VVGEGLAHEASTGRRPPTFAIFFFIVAALSKAENWRSSGAYGRCEGDQWDPTCLRRGTGGGCWADNRSEGGGHCVLTAMFCVPVPHPRRRVEVKFGVIVTGLR